MNYFSIDDAISNIKNKYTRELFKEVYSSYTIGNYRSAVVMLWSIIVTDLLLKLKDLDNIYDDPKAKEVLKKFKEEQEKNPTSSKWEEKIIDIFQNDFNFFETYESERMRYLQKIRHVSAHPVVDAFDSLFVPTREEVISLMRAALESVLLKDPLFSSRIIDVIISDLKNINGTITTYEDLKKFIESKYLKKISPPILTKLLKTLWKFSFKLENQDADINRKINLATLNVIAKIRKDQFQLYLENEKEWISNIDTSEKLSIALLTLISYNRWMLKLLTEEAQSIIKNLLVTKSTSYKYYSFFILLHENIFDYLKFLQNNPYKVTEEYFRNLRKDCIEHGILDEYYKTCIFIYTNSMNFDRSDTNFQEYILPYLNDFSIEHLKLLINLANDNEQTCYRSKARSDHSLIRDKILALESDFDLGKYEIFSYPLEN
ncbi:hypothetical protein [Acinetobacter modestus]|uniref:hypothetical protein n=1 Tax=Acinetobacter modestus TaxID=1776740 RepID=UPI001F4A8F2A|nr:hypothetical protein [Acinetobacter modestus]MCH7328170.1 hypothetical protein [Acinetobacter modestus]